MSLNVIPWGEEPLFEWDDSNQEKLWEHRVNPDEVEECFENDYYVAPHNKAKSQPQKYGDRYRIRGVTDGGRRLVVIIQYKGANVVRPITGWDSKKERRSAK